MPQLDSSITQHLADEQPTVAVLWIPLAADEGDPVAMRATDQAVDCRFEELLLGHQPVQRVALGVVVLLPRRAAPQLGSQEQIANAACGHPRLELLAVEVRREPRVWIRPHIHEELDSLSC